MSYEPVSGTAPVSIRGAANGAPSGRGIANALRGAGIVKDRNNTMEIDGGIATGPSRGAGRRNSNRSAGPMDQAGRHRATNNTPYGKPPASALPVRPGSNIVNLNRRGVGRPPPGGQRGRRAAEGTPEIVKTMNAERQRVQRVDHTKLSEKLGSEEMKAWLRSKVIAEGVMDLSNLSDDAWLKKEGIFPPGHPDAPPQAGLVFWRLIDTVIQKPTNTPVHTLSLANNGFHNLFQLSKLPMCLPYLRALDLSNNPLKRANLLDELLTTSERKGKANGGIGGLKSLTELKLNGVEFREKELARGADGAESYKHIILQKFPGLLILDGVPLNRIVFPVVRKPRIGRNLEERQVFTKVPFSFPVDVQTRFSDTEATTSFVNAFCAMFFPLFDSDRSRLLPGYAPNATISVSANTLSSRSYQHTDIEKSRSSRPNPVGFGKWTELPARNFFRNPTDVKTRMLTLHSPVNQDDLMEFWRRIPETQHPLEDAGKWLMDTWVVDGSGMESKICAVIQGEFRELPSGTYRSFSRTFILAISPENSPAQLAGWQATILSDMMTVSSYYGTASFDERRSVAVNGVSIVAASPAPAVAPNGENQEALISQVRQRTGMNVTFATMCLSQNEWSLEKALQNFEEIKSSIPAEAYQQ
ncbi:nuclear RNA export factor, partial [Tremellales sp. Uapishka_1]